MFSFLKRHPVKKLEEKYGKLLEEAMHCQRNGDIRQYSLLTEEAESLFREIEALRNERATS